MEELKDKTGEDAGAETETAKRKFALPKDKRERKRKMKELMAAQYPYIKVTDWNADALGILTWALKGGE